MKSALYLNVKGLEPFQSSLRDEKGQTVLNYTGQSDLWK